jgi:hypothetical protein
MHIVPMVPEANRAGIWYTGSATLSQLFGSNQGVIGTGLITIKQLVQLSDTVSMATCPTMSYNSAVRNRDLIYFNSTGNASAYGYLDEPITWIISENTGIDISGGTLTDVGYMCELISNAVVFPDFTSPIANDVLKVDDEPHSSK